MERVLSGEDRARLTSNMLRSRQRDKSPTEVVDYMERTSLAAEARASRNMLDACDAAAYLTVLLMGAIDNADMVAVVVTDRGVHLVPTKDGALKLAACGMPTYGLMLDAAPLQVVSPLSAAAPPAPEPTKAARSRRKKVKR